MTERVQRASGQAGATLEQTESTNQECMAILSEYKNWCKDYKKLCAIKLEQPRLREEKANPKRYAKHKKEWESLREYLPSQNSKSAEDIHQQ